MKGLTYIACPYGHPNREVIDYRMEMFYKVDAHLVRQGKFPISPMNKIYMVEKEKLDTSWNFWEDYSYALIHCCVNLVVITVKGWKESYGVQKEIEYAKSLGLEIIYLNPTTLE
jgi:hypothetical protein